ncbi:MAG: hypothetical protein BroJett040_14660 [Oligoflexia bacterium]|nr:MAG: hypothetical protein BroJett040_14660 [Oligoflexia bacterium]
MKSMWIVIMILTLLLSRVGYGATRKNLPLQPPPLTSKILIAIIDTGIDTDHPDLKSYLWKNPGETGRDNLGRDKSINGIDDDGNGFVDDLHGWNFASNTKSVMDTHGHGTHIAGIITEKQNPRSPKIELMALKYYDPKTTGVQNLRSSLDCLRYAIQMKAKVINYSGGGYEKSKEEEYLLRLAESQGILIIAAAGNDHINTDIKGFYPASYRLKNIISVAALSDEKQLLPSSNYGLKTTHLAAPGRDIFSTLPGNAYGVMSGTSQATAMVTRTLVDLYFTTQSLSQDSIIKAIAQYNSQIIPYKTTLTPIIRTAHQ